MNVLIVYCIGQERKTADKIAQYLAACGYECSICRIGEVANIDNLDFIVCIMPIPIFVRKLSRLFRDKFRVPGVVLVDPNLRWITPTLGVHSRGAIDLAWDLADLLKATVVDTTRHNACKCLEYAMFKLWLYPEKYTLRTDVELNRLVIVTDSQQIYNILRKYFNANVALVEEERSGDVYIVDSLRSSRLYGMYNIEEVYPAYWSRYVLNCERM